MLPESLLPFALEGMIAPMLIAFAICGIAILFNLPGLFAAALAAASLAPCMLAPSAFPPAKLLEYLPYFGLAAFLLFLPFDLKKLPGTVLHGVRWLFSLAAVWLLLKPVLAKWSMQEAAGNISTIVLLWAMTWSHIETVSKERPAGVIMLAIAAVGGGIALYVASSALLGQMSLSLGIALASWLFVAQTSPDSRAGHSGIALAYTLFASLMLIGAYYSEIPRAIILLVLCTFLADKLVQVLVQLKPDFPDHSVIALTTTLALVPSAIVIGIVILNYFQ